MKLIIPAPIIGLITFPGVILHEIAHKYFCDIYNIAVYEVYYFRPFSSIAGCVIHEPIEGKRKLFFVAMGPLIINSIACVLLSLTFSIKSSLGTIFVYPFAQFQYIETFTLWLSISIGLHAIPSNTDTEGLEELLKSNNVSKVFKIFLWILIHLIKICNLNYIGFWFKFVYAVSLPYIAAKIFIT